MSAAEPLPPALALSVVLHAALFAFAIFAGARHAAEVKAFEDPGSASWAGETLEVDGLVGVTTETAPAAAEETPAVEPPAAPEKSEIVIHKEKPKPAPEREHAKAEPKPKKETHAKAEEKPAASGEGSGESSTAIGTSGANAGIPSLGKAFTKALSAAAHRDTAWDDLPLGNAGSVRVTITTDDEGKITNTEIADREHVKQLFVRLVQNTVFRLGAGQFALSKGDVKAGTESLKIEVTLATGKSDPDADDPRHTTDIGFEPPSAGKPGRSYFTHASGRTFEAKVTIER
jgi:hypothetical protein